jgi:hypothetical protein
MGRRRRKHLVPTATPAFRRKSWRAFQITLDPLGHPKASPEGHASCNEPPLSVDAIAALMHG